MGYTDYLDSAMSKLVELLGGDAANGHTSVTRELPLLRALDYTTFLTQFSASVVHAVTANNAVGAADAAHDYVPRSDLVDSSGVFTGEQADSVALQFGRNGILVATYVSGIGMSGQEWLRTVNAQASADDDGAFTQLAAGTYYTPCTLATSDTSGGEGNIPAVRELMIRWQRCVDICAQAVASDGGANAQQPPGTTEGYYQALGQLALYLDVLAENPPNMATFTDAFSYAKTKVEGAVKDIAQDAGQAAAWVGNQAGTAAGAFAKGFFNQATLVTLVVAGIAVFVLLR